MNQIKKLIRWIMLEMLHQIVYHAPKMSDVHPAIIMGGLTETSIKSFMKYTFFWTLKNWKTNEWRQHTVKK